MLSKIDVKGDENDRDDQHVFDSALGEEIIEKEEIRLKHANPFKQTRRPRHGLSESVQFYCSTTNTAGQNNS